MFVEHKEAVEVTEAPAKTLKLSEAIRIGARIRPQCCGDLFSRDGRSCALGAAIEGFGRGEQAFEWLKNQGWNQPYHLLPSLRISRIQITNMNDRGMSREQIADWLEAQGL